MVRSCSSARSATGSGPRWSRHSSAPAQTRDAPARPGRRPEHGAARPGEPSAAPNREPSLAVRRVAASGGVLSLADLAPLDYLTLRDDAVARRMIDPNVERFVAEARARGGTLIRAGRLRRRGPQRQGGR